MTRNERIFYLSSRDNHQNSILAEDKPIVEGQRPEYLPLDLSEEFHIRGDRLSTAYRQALRGLGLGPRQA